MQLSNLYSLNQVELGAKKIQKFRADFDSIVILMWNNMSRPAHMRETQTVNNFTRRLSNYEIKL